MTKLDQAITVIVNDLFGEFLTEVKGTHDSFTDIIVVNGRRCGKRVFGENSNHQSKFYYQEMAVVRRNRAREK